MKRSSVNQIVEFLDLTLLASEGQIQRKVFGYNRTHSCYSNKKYAEMLRRGIDKGLYNKLEMKIPGIKSRIFYFRGSILEMEDLIIKRSGSVKAFLLENEY